MPINLKKIGFCLILSFCNISYSQEIKKREPTIVLIDLKSKYLKSYNINSGASFTFYYKGYETKKAREAAIKKFNNRKGDPDYRFFPNFTITFNNYPAFSPKPEKLKSLECVSYITLEEFRKNNFLPTFNVYIMYKLKDGMYLKWETFSIQDD